MNRKDFVVIIIRLFAIYFIVMAIEFLLVNISVFASIDYTDRSFIIPSIFSSVLKFIIGIFLWLYSMTIANFVIKNISEDVSVIEGLTLDRVQKVSISLVGIIIFVYAIPDLFEIIFSYIFPENSAKYTIDMMNKAKAEIPVISLVKVAVKIGLGIWLVLGANGIVAAIKLFWAKGKNI